MKVAPPGPLVTELAGDVLRLTLNRPRHRNALSPELVEALTAAVTAAAVDPAVRVIVIDGAGPTFCAGADLKHLRSLTDPIPYLRTVSGFFTEIERCTKPVVAVLHGHAVAGGVELALAVDVVVAETNTLIGDGHVRQALLPGGGSSVRLPRKVGEPLAGWLLLTGKLLPAEAFTTSGFVHAVADSTELSALVDIVVADLCAADGRAQQNMKRLLGGLKELTREAGQAAELEAFARNWHDAPVQATLADFTSAHKENAL
jgi:enoyl-CoA hydratase